jgi:hypothetical protein
MYNNFKDVKFDRLDGGLYTNDEYSKIPDICTPDCQNIDFATGGSITLRKGSKIHDTQNASVSGIKSAHRYERYDAVKIPMYSWSTYMYYYNRSTSSYNILSSGFTGNKIFGYADYDAYTYFCNGIDALFRWSGQYGCISATHAASATVLECYENLTKWLSAGEAIIGTQAVYYGSRTSGTLSAMTGISAIISDKEAIAEAPTSSRSFNSVSSVPRGNILHIDTERLFITGLSSNPEWMYYSRLGDPTDFTGSTPRVDSDGGYVVFGEGGGQITSLASREKGKIVVFKKHTIKGFEFVPLDNTSTDFPRVTNIAASYNCGAISHEGTCNVESNVFFVSPIDGVRTIYTDQDALNTAGISNPITLTFNNLDAISAKGIYFNKRYYLALKEKTAEYNNVVMSFDTLANKGAGAWTRYDGIYPNGWFELDGSLYYTAANERTVYKFLTGYDDNNYSYTSYWKSKLLNYGLPHEYKRMRYIYLEGYITKIGVLSCNTYFDDNLYNTKVIYGNGSYVDSIDTQTFGDFTFGDHVWGGTPGTSDVVLNKFRVRVSYSLQNFFNCQIELKTNKSGTVYRLDQLVPYVEQMDGLIFPGSNII